MRIKCKLCGSPLQKKVEKELLKKTPYVEITRKYGFHYSTLRRHKDEHMTKEVAASMMERMPAVKHETIKMDRVVPRLQNLSECISFVHEEQVDIYYDAKERGDSKTQLVALKQYMECLSLIIKSGEILMTAASHSSWQNVLPLILKAVKKHPEAKESISRAIMQSKMKHTVDDVL